MSSFLPSGESGPSAHQEPASGNSKTPLDLNSSDFDAEFYVQDLLRRKGLEELVAVEQDMVNNVRRLDSEMQSLVYENYSKFLNATSIVRNMQTRLAETHGEMRQLSSRMKKIRDLSDEMTGKFGGNCEKIAKLNKAKDSLNRLEFLSKTPEILQDCIEKGQFEKAVSAYSAVKCKLDKFRDIPSIAGISRDAEHIIGQLKLQLRERLTGRLISSEEVVEAVNLLKKLEVPEREMEEELLGSWGREIHTELDVLETNASPVKSGSRFPDIFEFVDIGCCHFLTNLSLMTSTFQQLFHKQNSKMELAGLLEKAMGRFEQIVEGRFNTERNAGECALFVKTLDRIYRKISVLTRLSSGFNFARMNANLVQRSAKHQIMLCRASTADAIRKAVAEVLRQLMSQSPPALSSSRSDNGRAFSSSAGTRHGRKELLRRALDRLEHAFLHSLKSSLAALLMFTASDIIFSSIPHFIPLFGFDVHEQIVVGSVRDLLTEIQQKLGEMLDPIKREGEVVDGEAKGTEMLVLCTFLRNLQLKHLDYLVELCTEQYRLSEFNLAEQHKLTMAGELAEELRRMVDTLLRGFVGVENARLIQMVRKSVDLFDWAGCSESPRRVRTLVKHLVHLVEEIEKDLAVFMDDGGLAKTKERTPDSLKGHSFSTMRRATSAASSVFNDASSLSSGGVVERLWGETEEETVPTTTATETAATIAVDFRRDMVVNALVRLMLRAVCDVASKYKFSRQGLEQMQVDCAFMRQKLWVCVGDEHMLNTLIDDVLTAAVNQCAEPKLLDPSVVRSICEEN